MLYPQEVFLVSIGSFRQTTAAELTALLSETRSPNNSLRAVVARLLIV